MQGLPQERSGVLTTSQPIPPHRWQPPQRMPHPGRPPPRDHSQQHAAKADLFQFCFIDVMKERSRTPLASSENLCESAPRPPHVLMRAGRPMQHNTKASQPSLRVPTPEVMGAIQLCFANAKRGQHLPQAIPGDLWRDAQPWLGAVG